MNKLAVIVGPLLSLAENQVDMLKKKGIQARLLNHQVRLSVFRSIRRFSYKGTQLTRSEGRFGFSGASDKAPFCDAGELFF